MYIAVSSSIDSNLLSKNLNLEQLGSNQILVSKICFAKNEDSDQTGPVSCLIRVSTGCSGNTVCILSIKMIRCNRVLWHVNKSKIMIFFLIFKQFACLSVFWKKFEGLYHTSSSRSWINARCNKWNDALWYFSCWTKRLCYTEPVQKWSSASFSHIWGESYHHKVRFCQDMWTNNSFHIERLL